MNIPRSCEVYGSILLKPASSNYPTVEDWKDENAVEESKYNIGVKVRPFAYTS